MSKELLEYNISPEDLEALKNAKSTMHNLSWAMRNINLVGDTIESKIKLVPEKYIHKLQQATESILKGIIKANLKTINKNKTFSKPSKKTYKAVVTGSGFLSGFFGSASGIGTPIFISELTLTTKFIMRSIMDIARSQGEDLYNVETQIACLEVFALGGDSKNDDGLETSYYALRTGLSSFINNASLSGSGAIANLISKIATRYSITVSEKFIAQAVPVLGGIGGGTINYIFIDHFQKMATAHFTIKKLERKYGQDIIQEKFKNILIENKQTKK
ncbi:EcsC family protein [Olleya aquimaris]|uniref:EcsC family protein n=1 Tax=Olleya aquimaris TaxID=639310 RepID=A0A327RW56_9FLAO|nr:EcsC family protein [Olleya aquimaris]RAJ17827.1 EcsC family protein [Olleya aquimaris]